MPFRPIRHSSLRVWRDGVGESGEMPELDIVAIHGLNPTSRSDHAESTWTCDDGTCWLTHKKFLPKKLPKARILCYSYNSALICVGSSIFDQAKDLVQRLHSERSGEHGDPRRPLLFIAHSLGGLLIKAALVAAVIAEGDIYRDLARCPKGLATFGTPHGGSFYATLFGLTTDIFKPLETLKVLFGDEPASHKGYRDVLRQGDATSHVIGVQFLDCYRSAIPITSFYEMKAFRGIEVVKKVVNKKSATLNDYRRKSNHRERRVGLNADHDGIVKFSRADRGLGRDVLVEIKRLADEVLRSGSTSGLASGPTESSTDDEASGPSQSAAASWEEGSVQYFGDDDVDIEMPEDEPIDSTDDGIDAEMWEDESIDSSDDGADTEMLEEESSSTSYPRRGTTSSSGPNARQYGPFNTHARPEPTTRSNIGHTQQGSQTTAIPPICFHCACSYDRQCPSHCRHCQKKRSYRSPKLSHAGNNKNRQSYNGLPRYWEEAQLCQRHRKQWSKTRDRPGSQRFPRSTKQPPFDSVRSSATPQQKFWMPAANAPPPFTSPQSSSPYRSRTRSPTPARRPPPPPPSPPPLSSSRRTQMEEEESEKARRKGRKTKLRKMQQDHSEPSYAHTPQWESWTPAQGTRRSERTNKDRRDLSLKQQPGRNRGPGLGRGMPGRNRGPGPGRGMPR